MSLIAFAVVSTALGVFAFALWQRQAALRREQHIRHFELPRGLFERLRKRRPEPSLKDCQLVAQALRQFFLAHLKSGQRQLQRERRLALTRQVQRSVTSCVWSIVKLEVTVTVTPAFSCASWVGLKVTVWLCGALPWML